MPICNEYSKIIEKHIRSEVKMGREQDRISRRIEKNPVAECNKI